MLPYFTGRVLRCRQREVRQCAFPFGGQCLLPRQCRARGRLLVGGVRGRRAGDDAVNTYFVTSNTLRADAVRLKYRTPYRHGAIRP